MVDQLEKRTRGKTGAGDNFWSPRPASDEAPHSAVRTTERSATATLRPSRRVVLQGAAVLALAAAIKLYSPLITNISRPAETGEPGEQSEVPVNARFEQLVDMFRNTYQILQEKPTPYISIESDEASDYYSFRNVAINADNTGTILTSLELSGQDQAVQIMQSEVPSLAYNHRPRRIITTTFYKVTDPRNPEDIWMLTSTDQYLDQNDRQLRGSGHLVLSYPYHEEVYKDDLQQPIATKPMDAAFLDSFLFNVQYEMQDMLQETTTS